MSHDLRSLSDAELSQQVRQRLQWWGGDPYSLDIAEGDTRWLKVAAHELCQRLLGDNG